MSNARSGLLERRSRVRGNRPAPGSRRRRSITMGATLILVVAAVALGAGLLLVWFGLGISSNSNPTADVEGPASPPEAFYSLTAGTPQAYPDTRLAIAFLALDDYLQKAVQVLGDPVSAEPDIFGTAYTWTFTDGASLLVSAWDDTQRVNGVVAVAPHDGPVRFSAFGGVVLGASTLREVVTAWGPGYQAAAYPDQDFVVSYVECIGPYPVVVKFDQAGRAEDAYAPVAGSRLWDMPVTALLIAYADEPAGSSGCPAPSPSTDGVPGTVRAAARRGLP